MGEGKGGGGIKEEGEGEERRRGSCRGKGNKTAQSAYLFSVPESICSHRNT